MQKGQPSNWMDTNHKFLERKDNNKKDASVQPNNDQASSHFFQNDNTNAKNTTSHIEQEVNNKNDIEHNNSMNKHPIYLGDAQNNYLKLISGTTLEEEQDNKDMYTSNHDHLAESSYNDDGDEDNSEDGYYKDEMSSEESDEFESIDSESFLNDDQP
ncbi:hypothetical protein K7X08_012796 [Anisodus acutangulus]|uniref:Uncharacterized protein n=1 Tax=Anisodus acutangulus TaxID=402998 RepID=A0A9Q1MDN0_9SOLA|nr:hypothetical protein K7X08_012796 [Anisodus acutangulus]